MDFPDPPKDLATTLEAMGVGLPAPDAVNQAMQHARAVATTRGHAPAMWHAPRPGLYAARCLACRGTVWVSAVGAMAGDLLVGPCPKRPSL
jgi:hypothetical protein